jgi:hypothetical protein
MPRMPLIAWEEHSRVAAGTVVAALGEQVHRRTRRATWRRWSRDPCGRRRRACPPSPAPLETEMQMGIRMRWRARRASLCHSAAGRTSGLAARSARPLDGEGLWPLRSEAPPVPRPPQASGQTPAALHHLVSGRCNPANRGVCVGVAQKAVAFPPGYPSCRQGAGILVAPDSRNAARLVASGS